MQSKYFFPKTVLCKECTYVQKDINESDENFDSTKYNEPTFSSSFFEDGPVFTVETIEERLNEMNLDMVQKKEKICHLNNITKIEQFNTKRGKQHSKKSHLQLR